MNRPVRIAITATMADGTIRETTRETAEGTHGFHESGFVNATLGAGNELVRILKEEDIL